MKKIFIGFFILIVICLICFTLLYNLGIFSPKKIKQKTDYQKLSNDVEAKIIKLIKQPDSKIIKKGKILVNENNAEYHAFNIEIETSDTFLIKSLKSIVNFSLNNLNKNTVKISYSFNGYILGNLIIHYIEPEKFDYICIVIDDVGNTRKDIDLFLQLKTDKITYAVMPGRPFAKYFIKKAKEKNIEYIIHQPMEPISYPKNNPGKYAIFTSMNKKQIFNVLGKTLKLVPGAIGLNNHMGSKVTADLRTMSYVLEFIKNKNLIFLDSYTTPKSIAYSLAQKNNIKTAINELFLDIPDDINYVHKRFNKLIRLAKKKHKVLSIGHIHSKATYLVLKNNLADLENRNIKLIKLSEYFF